MKGGEFNEFVRARIERDIKNLFLQFLYIQEELKQKGVISEEEYVLLRKRILDYGNSTTRSVDKLLESFNMEVKGEKASSTKIMGRT